MFLELQGQCRRLNTPKYSFVGRGTTEWFNRNRQGWKSAANSADEICPGSMW